MPEPNQKKVLLIDDEHEIVDILKGYLEEEGYLVEQAIDGTKGLALLESFRPDCMIVDLKLPDMSGIDILRKARETYPDTKVIVSTGYVDQSLMDEAEEFGRDAFIQKPFDLETIIKEIKKLLG